jgi:hypothetical protein
VKGMCSATQCVGNVRPLAHSCRVLMFARRMRLLSCAAKEGFNRSCFRVAVTRCLRGRSIPVERLQSCRTASITLAYPQTKKKPILICENALFESVSFCCTHTHKCGHFRSQRRRACWQGADATHELDFAPNHPSVSRTNAHSWYYKQRRSHAGIPNKGKQSNASSTNTVAPCG